MSESTSGDGASAQGFDELGARLSYWNGVLRDVPGSQTVSPELQGQIQDDLNTYWLYSGEPCVFSGFCQTTESARRGITGLSEDTIELNEGISDGFWVTRFGIGAGRIGHWAVAMGFYEQTHAGDDDLRQRRDHLLHTVAPYAVVPESEVNAAFADAEFPTVHSTLSKLSDEFAEKLHTAEFFGLTVEEQRYVIDCSINEAEEHCAKLDGGIKDRPVGIESAYGYVLIPGSKGLEYTRIRTSIAPIKGQSKGLTVLARRQLTVEKPIRNPKHLVDSSAGFCLTVSPDEATKKALGLANGQNLYIPLSSQDIEVLFNPEAIRYM